MKKASKSWRLFLILVVRIAMQFTNVREIKWKTSKELSAAVILRTNNTAVKRKTSNVIMCHSATTYIQT